jgi:hypothetical protein
MLVIHRVPDKFTTCSRHVHKFTTKNRIRYGSASILSATRSRLVHHRFLLETRSRPWQVHDKHVWSCHELVANESWSRPIDVQCRHVICTPSDGHHVILQAKTFSWRRNKADSVGDIFFRWIISNDVSIVYMYLGVPPPPHHQFSKENEKYFPALTFQSRTVTPPGRTPKQTNDYIYNSWLGLANAQDERFTPFLGYQDQREWLFTFGLGIMILQGVSSRKSLAGVNIMRLLVLM